MVDYRNAGLRGAVLGLVTALVAGGAEPAAAQQPGPAEVDRIIADTEQACRPQFEQLLRTAAAEGVGAAEARLLVARWQTEYNRVPESQLRSADFSSSRKTNPPVFVDLWQCMVTRQLALRGGAPVTAAKPAAKAPEQISYVGGTFSFPDSICVGNGSTCVHGGVRLILRAEDFQADRAATFVARGHSNRFTFNGNLLAAGTRYVADVVSVDYDYFTCKIISGKEGTIPPSSEQGDLSDPLMLMHVSCDLTETGLRERDRLAAQ